MTALLIPAVAAAVLSACAVPGGGTHETPALELPAGAALAPIAADWWKQFGDPQLDALVDEALRSNRDLARAMARIDESRGARGRGPPPPPPARDHPAPPTPPRPPPVARRPRAGARRPPAERQRQCQQHAPAR